LAEFRADDIGEAGGDVVGFGIATHIREGQDGDANFSTVELTGRSQRYKPRERALRIPRVNKATTTRFPAEGGAVLVETTGESEVRQLAR